MWIVAGVVVVVVVVLAAVIVLKRKRSRRSPERPRFAAVDEASAPVHALHDALRSVESLTDAAGSSLLDHVDRDGRTIRDRLASGEAHLDSLRQPDDTGPLLRRVLDEVAGEAPLPSPTSAPAPLPPPPPNV
jgi:hypothetical protein